jgi:hypothetical protein
MNAPLKLEDPAAIPARLRRELDAHCDLFAQYEYVDQVERAHSDIQRILTQLQQHLLTKRIHAYHCTREPEPGYFRANGLRVVDLREHRREFVETFGHRVTNAEREELYRQLESPIERIDLDGRNGMIWACLSRSIVIDHGTEEFFTYFGGEALRKWWDAAPIILPLLASVGQPVIIEASFPASGLNSYCNLAKTVLSQYHRTIRPDAYDHACEGFLRQPVPPQDVIAVTPMADFKS